MNTIFRTILFCTVAFPAVIYAQGLPPPPLPPVDDGGTGYAGDAHATITEETGVIAPQAAITSDLRFGMRSDAVEILQYMLRSLGYFPGHQSPTGYFGAVTKNAVMAFQIARGIPATGFVGPLTRVALHGATPDNEVNQELLTMNMGVGSSGQQVRALQNKLFALGYFSGEATGYFGVKTRAAVVAYQQAHGIPATGYVGPLTRASFAPIPPPHPYPEPPLGQAVLRYAILDKYPNIFFYDPDFTPIGRDDEQEKAIAAFDAIKNNIEEFSNILYHLGYEGIGSSDFTSEQKLAIYREHKKLRAISLVPDPPNSAPGVYLFIISTRGENKGDGERIEGSITTKGVITEIKRERIFITYPICLAGNTFIDTPTGQVSVKDIKEGMLVWSPDEYGSKVPVPVLQVSKVPVPDTHQMISLQLQDGRSLLVSPGHPTADGRRIGDLAIGDMLDGSYVVSALRVPYSEGFTYDILPESTTGTYWAQSILIGSTLQ